MANMTVFGRNLLNFDLSLTIYGVNSTALQYMYDRNKDTVFTTVSHTGATQTTISFNFSSPLVLSNIMLLEHNMSSFRIYYNSTTASALYNTTTNSATNNYISFSSVTVSSVSIDLNNVITAGENRTIGEFVLLEKKFTFDRNPSVNNYNPTIFRKQYEHEMPDGGVLLLNVANKYRASIKLDYISESFTSQLFSLYSTSEPFYFAPFPTTTSWDGKAYEVAWTGQYNFAHSTNDKAQGYDGSLNLKETPSA